MPMTHPDSKFYQFSALPAA